MRVFATSVANILGGEMNIHRGYMSRLGITEADAERVKPSLNNRVPTHPTCALLQPRKARRRWWRLCFRVHSATNTSPSGSSPTTRTPISMSSHGEWGQGDASEDYAAENRKLVAYMERLSEGYTVESQLARLTDIFVACSRYESMFWDMAWNEAM